jgi:folate-binding protein YgfZ
MRLELSMVQPSFERVTETCSLPIGTERMKIVYLDETGAGVCRAAPVAPAETAARVTSAGRIEWSESMADHHTVTVDPGEYAALRQGAGLVDRSDRGRIVVSGSDRRSYLHGLLTNDIAGLKAGEGCYAAYLTPQGRMLTDLAVYELGDVLLLTLDLDVKDAILAKLDQFVFSEDVQLGDVTGTFAAVAIAGPRAAAIVESVITGAGPGAVALLADYGNVRAEFAGRPVIILRITDTGEPGYELLVDVAQGASLAGAFREAGAVDVGTDTSDAVRIEAGVPKFHRDMDEETIPLEAGIESRAISLTKGCYVGQEVIIRVLHRGHGRVARKLVGLTIAGTPGNVNVPPPDTPIHAADGRDIGRITSSAWSPAMKSAIALGYVQRDFLEVGTKVTIGGEGAVVTAVPFVSPR